MAISFRFNQHQHKAGRAALWLSCVACFELSASVYADNGAAYNILLMHCLPDLYQDNVSIHLLPEMAKTLQRCCRNHAKMQFWMTPYPTFECFRLKVLAEACLIAPAPANTPAGASALLVRAARPEGRPPSRRCHCQNFPENIRFFKIFSH